MLSVDDALWLVVQHAGRQPTTAVPLHDALGLVLAEPVVSDLDSPPFDKSLMDGFAVRNADLTSGSSELRVIGELFAGAVADRAVGPGECYQIMTGAPIPEGAGAVVMVERTRRLADDRIAVQDPSFTEGQNVMPRGRELSCGEAVLEPGHVIGPAESGILANVGCTNPQAYRRPRVALISTGDEIVNPEQTPAPGQIRNSNAATLFALSRRAGADVADLGIARDTQRELSAKIAEALAYDVAILTGGVSAGKRDLVPAALSDHGVEQVFHKVSLKPGKPVWFGRHANGLVFGLPGNPVAVLVCFELFVRTALRARQAYADPLPQYQYATLASDFRYRTDRPTYHPARTWWHDGQRNVEPVAWFGSPDLKAIAAADVLMHCRVSDQPHARGAIMEILPLGCV